jgi:hypothetical protein
VPWCGNLDPRRWGPQSDDAIRPRHELGDVTRLCPVRHNELKQIAIRIPEVDRKRLNSVGGVPPRRPVDWIMKRFRSPRRVQRVLSHMIRWPTFLPAAPTKTPPRSFIPLAAKPSPPGLR